MGTTRSIAESRCTIDLEAFIMGRVPEAASAAPGHGADIDNLVELDELTEETILTAVTQR